MLKSLLVLPDGQQISSGVGTQIAVRNLTLTESVNRGEELALGSVCAAVMEAELFTPEGCLSLNAGDEIRLYQVNEAGEKINKGRFLLEKPTRPSANLLRLVGYDRMVLLDRDMSEWVESLSGWPYRLSEFADMVCTACGLELVQDRVLNGDFPVEKFSLRGLTGRQIMGWIGEIAGCFCRTDPEGKLHLDWYKDAGLTVEPTGAYQQSLVYETYQVKPVDRVQINLSDSKQTLYWPGGEEGDNCYVIEENPILMAEVSDNLRGYLLAIENRLKELTYTPCRLAVPADRQVEPGTLITVKDRNGVQITTCVMTKTGTARKSVLESTGSPLRNSASAYNNRNSLNNLRLAVYTLDGKRIASLINMSPEGIRIQADKIKLEGLVTANGYFKVLEDGSIQAKNGKIAGWNMDNNSLYTGESFSKADCFFCTGSLASMSVAGSGERSGWMLKAGKNFGVLKDGTLYAQDAKIAGSITSDDVHITGGTIVIPQSDTWDQDEYMRLCNLDRISFGFGKEGLCVSNLNLEKRAGCGFYILNNMMSFQWAGGGIPFLTVDLFEAEQPVFYLNGTWMLNAAPIITSDENAKENIQPQAEVYSQVFDRLKPVTFRYKDGHSGRTHLGLIAQDVERAVVESGLDTKDFAPLCRNGNQEYGIRYEELVSMLIGEVQKLKKQVTRLEEAYTMEEKHESNQ